MLFDINDLHGGRGVNRSPSLIEGTYPEFDECGVPCVRWRIGCCNTQHGKWQNQIVAAF